MSKSVKVNHIYVGGRAPAISSNIPLLWVDTAAEPPMLMVTIGKEWAAVSPPEVPAAQAVEQKRSYVKKAPHTRKPKDELES